METKLLSRGNSVSRIATSITRTITISQNRNMPMPNRNKIRWKGKFPPPKTLLSAPTIRRVGIVSKWSAEYGWLLANMYCRSVGIPVTVQKNVRINYGVTMACNEMYGSYHDVRLVFGKNVRLKHDVWIRLFTRKTWQVRLIWEGSDPSNVRVLWSQRRRAELKLTGDCSPHSVSMVLLILKYCCHTVSRLRG